VSLKVTGKVVVELLDVEYYCHLEMWVCGNVVTKGRDLRIGNFRSNRISTRIGG